MEPTSQTPQQEKLKALQALLPEAFAEGKIDWEKLKATLGEDINFSNERYVLNWAGKSDAFKVLQTPSTKTLVPCPDESVKADGTTYNQGETFQIPQSDLGLDGLKDDRILGENKEIILQSSNPENPNPILQSSNPINPNSDNIFIEGENLEVLKVLQKSYFGKVKMIYIDPPYNTGNDSFIYPDKFAETKAEYEKRVGDKDEEGYMTKDGMFKKNSKENGQYHSNWLNMMMPRLYLAKNLLRQDGVIFVSIDDNEVHNLRLLMNEVFGEENFVGQWNWFKSATPPNLSKKIKKNIEYVLGFQKGENNFWEIPSEKGKIIQEKYDELKTLFLNDFELIQTELRKWIRKQTNGNDLSGVSHYSYVDEKGVFYPGNSANTKDGGYKYDITHPLTKKTCAKPEYGYRFPFETFNNADKNGDVLWGRDEKTIPKIKKRLDTVTQKLKSYYYEDNRATTADLKTLFGGNKIFNNPKSINFIKHISKFILNQDDLILDFFAGSGTTAHAVMELNKEDGGNRKYICVQLPELCDEASEAYKAGYKTIADISKERIRRAGKKIQSELGLNGLKDDRILDKNKKKKPQLFKDDEILKSSNPKNLNSDIDLGFKVLKLADSNFKQWQQIEGKDAKALTEQMQFFIDPVSENATIENMVYEFLLKSGKDLNSTVRQAHGYFIINNGEMIMLLESVDEKIIEQVIGEKPMKVIALDKLFEGNDQLKTNTVLGMRDAGIEFKTI